MKDQSPATDQRARASGWSIYWHQLWRPTAAENFESIRKGCQSNNHPIAGQVAGYSLGLVGGITTLFAGKLLAAPLGSARDACTRKSLASTDIDHVKSFFNDNSYQSLPDKYKAIFDKCSEFLKKHYDSRMPRSSSSRELIELIRSIAKTPNIEMQSTLKQDLFIKCKAFIEDPEGCHLGKTTYALMVNHISTNLQSEATKKLTINGI